MPDPSYTFHWADYLVCCLSFAFSVAIGIFFACVGGKQKTADEFLLADRKGHLLPVGISMAVSVVSAVHILGEPAEIYFNGTLFVMIAPSMLIIAIIAAHIYVPLFRGTTARSAYEYLEMRFNYPVRLLGTFLFTIQMLLLLSVTLYAPAVAFNAVAGISMDVSIVVVGAACIIYTTVGGMKAVLWTDTLQSVVIVTGILLLLIKGSNDAGGIAHVWETADQAGKLEWINWDVDPRTRHTTWTQWFGYVLQFLPFVGSNQMFIQRYLVLPTTRQAQGAVYLQCALLALVVVSLAPLGLIIFTYYQGNNPLNAGRISNRNQMVPLFLMDILGHLHGIPGLFAASIACAALSSVSSAVNSLATVYLEDIVKPLLGKCGTIIKQNTETRVAKALALLFGLLAIGMSYVAKYVGLLILQLTFSIIGTVGGPLLGLFTIGMFIPWVNCIGASVGTVAAVCITLWANIGAILRDPANPGPLDDFYQLSYLWYSFLSLVVNIPVAMLVSIITGYRRGLPPLDERLLVLPGNKCFKCCPISVRTGCNYGYGTDQETWDEEKKVLPKDQTENTLTGVDNESLGYCTEHIHKRSTITRI